MSGDVLIPWTIRLSLLLYATVVWCRWQPVGSWPQRLARWLWGLGALLLLSHTLAAFHFAHHWSHAHAYAATAKGTYDVIGINWGGGLYVNYVFTLAWLADAAWWLIAPTGHAQRLPWLTHLLHLFLAFIILNATIIFHSGLIRWSGLCICVTLLMVRTALHIRTRASLLGNSSSQVPSR